VRHSFVSLLLATAVSNAAAVEVADYRFQDSLASSIDGAPALVQRVPGRGGFVDTVVDGVTTRGWAFVDKAGFELPIAGLISDSTWSIAMLLRVENPGGYSKLLDVGSLTSDAGLYYQNGALVYYPDASSDVLSVEADTCHQVVLTRAADGEMVGYVDGVEQFRFFDMDANGVVLDGKLVFLRDDAITDNEDATGVVSRIRVFSHTLPPQEVRALRQTARIFHDSFERR